MAMSLIGPNGIRFDGNVGDLGSKPGPSFITVNWECKGFGTKEQLLEFAHNALKGKEILSEEVTEDNTRPGFLKYAAQVRSSNGI